MKLRRATGLVWRLYAVGLVQFVLVVLSAIAIGYMVIRLPQRQNMESLLARLKPYANDRVAVAQKLRELRERDELLASVYDFDRQVLVSNVVPALPLPQWTGDWPPSGSSFEPGPVRGLRPPVLLVGPERNAVVDESPRRFGPSGSELPLPPDSLARFVVEGKERLIIARFKGWRPSPLPVILTMVSGLLVLGVGAFLTARWIAQPLKHLSSTARSLGQGDLRARSELQRDDELGEVARAFNEMAERIQRLLQTEKELLANVAHELRTPLARIRVALELAAEGDAETARASLAEIAVDLGELETLIDGVLTATRFELAEGEARNAGGFALQTQAIAPDTIAARSAELFRARHPNRPFSVGFAPTSRTIAADPVLLRRVIDNLLENAHKYSPDPETPISLDVSERGDHACFEVRDYGSGIPAQDLPLLFTAFFRGERSRSRDTGGVGLGLTLSKHIIEAHAGRIEVESELGVGSTFRALVPVQVTESRIS